ncbi:acetyl-CoA carboxylase, biotin carboxylase, partial [mine drainage metagenome]
PTPEQFQACRDKFLTVQLAEQVGVPVPHAIAVSTLDEAKEAMQTVAGPVVIKARESSGGRGIAFIDTPEDLEDAWKHFDGHGAYIQQRVPSGRKFDVCLLYDANGILRRKFVQEETRWYPTETSVSTVQRSVHRPDLIDLAVRTIAPIGWRGIVELEYMEDENGTPWLLEINPRLWSSVELAVQCGIDFPTLAVKLALGERIPPDPGYAADQYCVWSMPGELLRRFRCFVRRDREGRRRACPVGTHDNILSMRDPMPVLGVFVTVLRHSLDISLWRHLFCRP